MLEELASGLWVDARPLRLGPIEIGARMSVVRLSDGGLFLYCPVEIDAACRAALEALGPVRFLVAGNKLHHFYLRSAVEAFPKADLYGPPGLAEKCPGLSFAGELSDVVNPGWSADLDQIHVGGMPRTEEVVFLHRASRTLLLTDISFNVQHSRSLLTRLFLRVNNAYGRFGPSRMLRSMVRDRAALRASVDRILAWDFDRVVVTHGDVLGSGGREALRTGFAWLR